MALTLKQALAMFWEQIQVQFVKRENGKGLSTNDFTTEEKNKLASLENTTIDTTLTISNAAADAKTVGDALAEKQPAGDYALKSEIPSTEGLATQEYVNTQIQAALTINYDDLAFDTTEIVFTIGTTSTLGQAILGQMVLA